MHDIDVDQAKIRFSELIEQTINGNEVIITKGGQPIVKLIAITKPGKKRHFGSAKNYIKISNDFDEPLEDFQEYM